MPYCAYRRSTRLHANYIVLFTAAVMPLLMQAMSKVAKERPDDPISAIAEFLQAHNPKIQKAAENAE
jgi:Dpy-30 motif